tara:strand:+ start:211 stop:354 length:144 start_codon:yes stop_codon:yes gene_type:complete
MKDEADKPVEEAASPSEERKVKPQGKQPKERIKLSWDEQYRYGLWDI